MQQFNNIDHPHRRYNPLLDEWVLVSPQRTKRPWQGQQEKPNEVVLPSYDSTCYLCPGNTRSNGEINPTYESAYVFDNDFPALMIDEVKNDFQEDSFFTTKPERGINKVICFSPKHDITLPEMEVSEIVDVIKVWQQQYVELGSLDYINNVQIFENKGAVMGCSNPHPHCQVWAQESIPTLISKTGIQFKKYFDQHQRTMLSDYLNKELVQQERIVFESEYFAVVVPFWAVWPYETMIVSKRALASINELTKEEVKDYAEVLKRLTTKYDNLFNVSFPYSAGIHQAPTDGENYPEWHFHHHFYPPLLRSAEVKKFMVGYEMLAEPQRDITAEKSAEILRNLSEIHYKIR